MTNPFAKLSTQGLEKAEDRTGGGFQALNTNMYLATIKALYGGASPKGALSVTLIADIEGREYTETQYVTNKNQENWFTNKKTGKKEQMPGFVRINNLCQLLLGTELANVSWVQKQLEIYDFEARDKVRKALDCIDDVQGQKVYLAIRKDLINKQAKNGDGEYEDTAETRTVNVWVGEAHGDLKLTVNEAEKLAAAGEELSEDHAKWFHSWIKNNVDPKDPEKAYDNRNIKDGAAGTAGAPKAGRADNGPPQAGGSGAPKPLNNLFPKK